MELRNKTDKYLFKTVNRKVSMFHPSGYMIPDEEPILIFRAKDLGTLSAISAYLNMLCEQTPSQTIKDHLISMLEVTSAILNYQKNKEIKSVTCSIRAHESTIKYLNDDVEEAIKYAKAHLKTVYKYTP